MKFNTAIAAMMTMLNSIYQRGSITKGELKTFITLLNPFAPHLTEEMNERLGEKTLLAKAAWPQYDPARCVDDTVEIVLQVNGKIKARKTVPADSTQEQVRELALAEAAVGQALEGKTLVKEIFVKGKLMNFVVR